MPAKIVVHSFMRETGKTNIAAGLAYLMAARGERVGIIDADIPVPLLHSRLGVDAGCGNATLNDFLMGNRSLEQAALELPWRGNLPSPGALVFVPASPDPVAIRGVLRQDIDIRSLNAGIEALTAAYHLGVTLINAPAGLDEISLSCMALADVLVVVLRLDKEAYQGTSVTLDLARGLNVPKILLVVNRVGSDYELEAIRRSVAETYQCEVPVVLSAADEAAMLFVDRATILPRSAHPLTALLQALTQTHMDRL